MAMQMQANTSIQQHYTGQPSLERFSMHWHCNCQPSHEKASMEQHCTRQPSYDGYFMQRNCACQSCNGNAHADHHLKDNLCNGIANTNYYALVTSDWCTLYEVQAQAVYARQASLEALGISAGLHILATENSSCSKSYCQRGKSYG
eukprot:366565-Chlamydomonas_euryale.AAC.3